jgi:hypothetical protein
MSLSLHAKFPALVFFLLFTGFHPLEPSFGMPVRAGCKAIFYKTNSIFFNENSTRPFPRSAQTNKCVLCPPCS